MEDGVELVVGNEVIEVDRRATLGKLKTAIEDRTGYDMRNCTLLADDQELKGDDIPLCTFGLTNTATLTVKAEDRTLAAAYLHEKSVPVTTSALIQAARSGAIETVQLLIEAGVPVNVATADTTPLIEACSHGVIPVVELLLDLDADPNCRGKWRTTPLMSAAAKGHTHIVSLLVEYKARLDLADSRGWTALMAAASVGFVDVVRLLVSSHADVNVRGDGVTALVLAAKRGTSEVVTLLLEAGADVTVCAPLLAACENGHQDTVRLLLKHHAPVNYQDANGWSALMNAAWNNHEGVVHLLLSNGARINLVSTNGRTALQCAIHQGHTELQELLATYT